MERVRDVVAAIPPGQTLSYGEVAARAGIRSARLVGRILSEDGHDLPWHRVLRANGTSAPQIAQEQAARLRAEGVLMVDGRLPPEHRRSPARRRGATGDGSRTGDRPAGSRPDAPDP